MTRAYDMTRRARRAAETGERIAEVTERLLAERPVEAVTLQGIAEGAGVSVQTVLRHMGSRDGCFEAAKERVRARIEARRGTPPGDLDRAIGELLVHYESEGRLVLNLLAQESSHPLAREASMEGRAYHRAWVARCFGELDEVTLDALVSATDLYVWKLLRLDLGRSPEATAAVVIRLVRAVLESR